MAINAAHETRENANSRQRLALLNVQTDNENQVNPNDYVRIPITRGPSTGTM